MSIYEVKVEIAYCLGAFGQHYVEGHGYRGDMLVVMVMIARRLGVLSRHPWHAFLWASLGEKRISGIIPFVETKWKNNKANQPAYSPGLNILDSNSSYATCSTCVACLAPVSNAVLIPPKGVRHLPGVYSCCSAQTQILL